MHSRRNHIPISSFIAVLLSGITLFAVDPSSVKVWEEPLIIRTSEIGPPDPAPMFYAGRAYQGAKGKIYPYPLYDNLLDVEDLKTYQAVYLENKYVKICVLPELGGRIFAAQDKTNGYDYVYRQTTIKPALIGMIGAWISGGVEWNIPHHHRASSYLPVDHILVKNRDGSGTIWVGEVEHRHRMKWLVGLTLYPDKSYLEVTTKLLNGTSLAHSFLDFTNTSVHANRDYQVLFPSNTQFVTQHSKVESSHWPISHEIYGGVDYRQGVDISWWKNHPSPVSFFNWGFDGDFFGGYDHGRNAGIISVQDHYVSPGAKFFEWGAGPEGEMWDKVLDTQGPYLELMAGNFSNNQPDYSWDEPYGEKVATQFWFPIRDIGGARNANINGAVNLEMDNQGKVYCGFSTTQEFKDARILVEADSHKLLDHTATLTPSSPFVVDVVAPSGTKMEDLKVSLLTSEGKVLISYQEEKHALESMPTPGRPPASPSAIKSVDELYQTGMRLDQLHNPAAEPYPYFEEALRRDPDNYEVNTALGRLYCERGMWREAEKCLGAAVARASRNYTRAKDGEASYYLGVALRGEGNNAAATDAFQQAAWDVRWQAPGRFALAEIASQNGESLKALGHLQRSLEANTQNTKAWGLKAAVLRRLGRISDAEFAARQALAIDPMDLWAAHELTLLKSDEVPGINLGDPVQSNLELAVDYYKSGMIDEATGVLQRLASLSPDRDKVNPIVYYYLGYFAELQHHASDAAKYYQQASHLPVDYVFPFRLETAKVLAAAMESNPADARAPYYLGNLLFDLQPQAAIQWWEKAARLDNSLAIVRRNLALAYQQTNGQTDRAIARMEEALKLDPNNSRYYCELDKLYEAGNVAPEKRIASFEQNPSAAAKRSDTLMQEIKVLILLGKYDRAIELLGSHHFHNWEGEPDVHDVYMDAHILRGENRLDRGEADQALKDFDAALDYPENLEVGKPYRPKRVPEVYWLMGVAYQRLGNNSKAQNLCKMVTEAQDASADMDYYHGLAEQQLGDKESAGRYFDGLIQAGEKQLVPDPEIDYFAKFGRAQSSRLRIANAHYLIAMGNLAKGDRSKAASEFRQALVLDANNLGARRQLAALNAKGGF